MKHQGRAVKAFVALGSNLGEPRERLAAAREALAATPGISELVASPEFRTSAVGGPADQPEFLNAVVSFETDLSPGALLARLQEIERAEGRERGDEVRWGPRRLDLDLLLYGEARVESAKLSLPHPRLEERVFVLAPLAELAPELVLPGCGSGVRERLAELRGPLARCDAVEPARAWCREQRAAGKTLGFVPTMGALHAGHLELVRRALRENDLACVSVFVNPLQFDEEGDFVHYPRDLDGDAEKLASIGASMVFTGTLEQFFPGELDAAGRLPRERHVPAGPWATSLEGEYRVGHFDGVATIVDRLFEVVEPTRAYFGQKDYQQARIVGDVAARRGGPEVVVCPTSREPSGLARSSRNLRLDAAGLEQATALSRGLFDAARLFQAGERRVEALRTALRAPLEETDLALDYAELRSTHAWSASEPEGELQAPVALVAARVGEVRLIDCFVLSDPVPTP